MTATTYTQSEQLIEVSCFECGIRFGLPQSFYERRRDDHRDWTCPNGHEQHFIGKTKAQQVQEQLDRERRWAADDKDRLTRQRDLAERRVAAYKGNVTKLKKRVAAGLCPCCNRSFVQLRRHIEGQHPDYSGELPDE